MKSEEVDQLFDIEGRVAVITGGSRGIGRSIAHGFAAKGAKVVISSRKADMCDKVVEEITADGGDAFAVPGHMGDLDDIKTLVQATVDHYGGIDIIVNNAANALAQDFGSITPEAWEKSFDVNLRGPVFLVQEALPYLKASEHASVINVSSAGGYLFSAFTHIYAAAKAGLISYTRSLAADLAPHGIRVNCMAPGTIDTDMVRAQTEERQQSMAKASLLGRAAVPDELIGLALFMATEASSFMTGCTINYDGGLVPR